MIACRLTLLIARNGFGIIPEAIRRLCIQHVGKTKTNIAAPKVD
jgi:hypothetical protein